MPRTKLTPAQRTELDLRQRASILQGLAASITDKGYAPTTVSDIVTGASVSKSTFYAHFADKEDVFLALIGTVTEGVLAVIERTAVETEDLPWRLSLERVVEAYLGAVASQPEIARCFLIETAAVSPRALAIRSKAVADYVALILRLSARSETEEGVRTVTPSLALAVVAGINELMIETIERDGPARLGEITPDAVRLAIEVVSLP